MSTRAFVLIDTKVGAARKVAVQLRSTPHVISAHVVTGDHDIIATVEVPDGIPGIGALVANEFHRVSGILRTLTCVVIAAP